MKLKHYCECLAREVLAVPVCGVRHPGKGWKCTRHKGHVGMHAACGTQHPEILWITEEERQKTKV